MSTRFNLLYPFNEKWLCGYIVTNPERRRNVCLVGGAPRTTISYARYLMSVKLGRFLKDDEHVDHIDHDKTNDTLRNLQLINRAENIGKENKRRVGKA